MDEKQRLEFLEKICLPLFHHASGSYNKWKMAPDGKKAFSYVDAQAKLKGYFKEKDTISVATAEIISASPQRIISIIEDKKLDNKVQCSIGDRFEIDIYWEPDKITRRNAICIDPKFTMHNSATFSCIVLLDKPFKCDNAASQKIFGQYVDTAISLGVNSYKGYVMWFIDDKTKIVTETDPLLIEIDKIINMIWWGVK